MPVADPVCPWVVGWNPLYALVDDNGPKFILFDDVVEVLT
jgi:hypothetical protein